MTTDDSEKKKTQWRVTESVMNSNQNADPEPPPAGELVPTNDEESLPEAPSVDVPQVEAPSNILMKFKENKLSRKAALTSLEANYNTQLDTLKHTLSRAAQVQKARADVLAEQHLKELDSRQLEILSELGLRNKETRERALLDLTEKTVEKLREVESKDWPQSLIEETINQLLELRKRTVGEIMKELGDYSE